MLIGATMSGKTTVINCLYDALNVLYKRELNAREVSGKEKDALKLEYKYKPVKYEIINPKAISLEELYGFMDNSSGTP